MSIHPVTPASPRYKRMPRSQPWERMPGAPMKVSGMPGHAEKQNGPNPAPVKPAR